MNHSPNPPLNRSVNRIVVKVGTSTLTDAQGRLDRAFIADLTAQLATLRLQGCDVLLVSSGAIRAGRQILRAREEEGRRQVEREGRMAEISGASVSPTHFSALPYKQAAAAIGQGQLMHTYTEAFAWRNVDCAQVLLTRDDLSDRKRFLNARHTLLALLDLGVVPVINENDTVSVDEIKFGDNDMLAALVATLVEADLLLILSDVEGLYARPPGPAADEARSLDTEEGGAIQADPPEVIATVTEIDGTIAGLAHGSRSGAGTGGMRTKVEAARIATASGVRTVIARGRRERVVLDVAGGNALGTTFVPRPDADRLSARKRWIGYTARPHGFVTVNTKAREKLVANGVSLLAAGIVKVSGTFVSGDLIEVGDEAGNVFARGLTNYADNEVRRVMGLRSEQFETVLGYRGCDEVIHRDNLVLDLAVGQRRLP